MIQWPEDIKVYLHREPVDFRKAINGLSVIVQDEMALSPFDAALFVFCNKKRRFCTAVRSEPVRSKS